MVLFGRTNKPLFIVNAEANEKKSSEKWKDIESNLDNAGIKYKVKFTSTRKEAVDLVRKDKRHKIIIVYGGDGGVNALVEGAMKNDLEKILGTIPGGTANDIARTFDIYKNPKKFYSILSNEQTQETDVGEVNGKYFLGHARLGFDALTLKERNKRRFFKGKLAYFSAVFRALFQYTSKKMKIKTDNENEIDKKSFMTVVSNIPYYADGMKIAPLAKTYDDLLDLCLIEGESSLGLLLRNLPLVYSGKHLDNLEVYYRQTKGLEISSAEPVFLQIDGDLIEENDNFKFGIADKKVNMLSG
jgi:diacylglycerol kinase (ATP)